MVPTGWVTVLINALSISPWYLLFGVFYQHNAQSGHNSMKTGLHLPD
jgi:hypothetical protein